MTKFADKLCDKLHDKICRQSLSTAADEYLTFWFLCIFLVSATHTKTSRAYIQLAVEGFPFCRSHLQVPASSVCIAHTHASTDGRVHAPHRCQEIGRMALRHAGTSSAGKRARARTQKQVPTPVEVLGREQPRRRSGASRAQGLHWVVHLPLGCKMNSSLQMQMNSSLRASVS